MSRILLFILILLFQNSCSGGFVENRPNESEIDYEHHHHHTHNGSNHLDNHGNHTHHASKNSTQYSVLSANRNSFSKDIIVININNTKISITNSEGSTNLDLHNKNNGSINSAKEENRNKVGKSFKYRTLAYSNKEKLRIIEIQKHLDRVGKCLHVGTFHHSYTRLFNLLNFDAAVASSQEAHEHYRQLLLKTAKFRNLPYHDLKGYTGPWIENYFIESFIDKPLSYFGGLFPLFVQWEDYKVIVKLNRTDHTIKVDDEMIFDDIRRFLRPDLVYIAVAQGNNGLRVFQDQRSNGNNLNVLVLSAGGEGNVAVPLIKGDLNESTPFNRSSSIQHIIGFYGSVENGPRQRIIAKVATAFRRYNVTMAVRKGPQWIDDISSTLFNLAPPGWGKTSFRLGEVLQLGRIPVYVYDTTPWLPYEGTAFGLQEVAILCKETDIEKAVVKMMRIAQSEEAVNAYLGKIRKASWMYRYAGVVKQLELFFSDPFGPNGGLLKCSSIQPPGISVLRTIPLR
mmetsp:Transcript_8572/g.12778  ORF Transcript_8572/g.12778 Transcript_8572/m.12778 type:complete len:511 (-) Transcript_8572:2351-3883(-)|eukprot:CAMPEP_0170091532 /NCGR_PEP_ID=MMETSP0019_2-20121128/25123_1 /TAXON_ID=98059 /ORGANISM="Dinobryon sp., Strain UTEXLB2267" /LENGTH=510 /DNA_ID=CAMNT_0010311503 /DNA_START=46 /DNA_END=1578 /DNA_ORIENTATION=+